MIALTFDLGQTGFRARVTHGHTPGPAFSGSGYVMGTPLLEAMRSVVSEASTLTGATRFDTIAGGLTGVFGNVPDITETARDLNARYGTTRVVLADDAVTSSLGAAGGESGVVVSLGTGLVALARGESGTLARVDGVGPMVGDEGSGWWMGRQGLVAALSASDGREPSSARLLAAAEKRYGSVAAIPVAVASAASPIGEVAGFARVVVDAARAGDATARAITTAACGHIARAIVAAATRAGLTTPLRYSLVGGLASAGDLLLPQIAPLLESTWGEINHRPPRGTSLDGADRLLIDASVLPHGPLLRETTLAAEGER